MESNPIHFGSSIKARAFFNSTTNGLTLDEIEEALSNSIIMAVAPPAHRSCSRWLNGFLRQAYKPLK